MDGEQQQRIDRLMASRARRHIGADDPIGDLKIVRQHIGADDPIGDLKIVRQLQRAEATRLGRRRRPHAAGASRILAAGLSTSAMLLGISTLANHGAAAKSAPPSTLDLATLSATELPTEAEGVPVIVEVPAPVQVPVGDRPVVQPPPTTLPACQGSQCAA